MHMSWLTTLYAGRRIHLKEVGYPSSVFTASSEETQARFVSQLFAAWDQHADQIEFVGYFQLTDFSPSTVDYYVGYYGYDVPIFRAFLGTLGLRTWAGSGSHKLAWDQFVVEARARGW